MKIPYFSSFASRDYWAKLKASFLLKKGLLFRVLASVAAVLVVSGGVVGIISFREHFRLQAKIKTNPEWVELYASAKEGDKLLRADKNNFETYLSAGFRWKSIADATNEAVFYRKSLEVYEKAMEKWSGQYLAFMNAANVARYLKEFEKADGYYLKAITSNPGEASTYVARAEFLRYDLKKNPEEMKKFYESGMKVLIGQESMTLAVDYASYLRNTGQYAEALDLYKKLALVKPNFEQYRIIIQELEEKLKEMSENQSKE